MPQLTVTHLIDDTTAGGVMRVLDFLAASSHNGSSVRHTVAPISRSGTEPLPDPGDILVSHLSLNWRRLPWFMSLRARFAHLPMVHVEHSYTQAFIAENAPRPVRLTNLLGTIYALFDRVVAVSDTQAHWLRRTGLVSPAALVSIPSAVDVQAFLNIPIVQGTPRIVGAIGRLAYQKGFDKLIAAMRACTRPDLQLHIFGEGGEQDRLEALSGRDSRIVFKGHCDPARAMASVDVIAMPSRWEAYGLVALEARAAGRVLLCTDVDGLNDHIRDGGTQVGPSVAKWTNALSALTGPVDEANLILSRTKAKQADTRFLDGWSNLIKDLSAGSPSRAA